MQNLLVFLLAAGVIGLAAHFVGEALPRRWFRCDRFPYAAHAWERGGRVYNRLHIEKWKDKLPDKSKFVKSTVRKSVGRDVTPAHMLQLAAETCVAECIHLALLLISPVMLLLTEPPFSVAATLLYGLSNVPYILIQRYNRPRLLRYAARAEKRIAEAT